MYNDKTMRPFKEFRISKEIEKSFSPAEMEKLREVVAGKRQLDDNLFGRLYDIMSIDMPYGVAKARTGDPDQWISDNLDRYIK